MIEFAGKEILSYTRTLLYRRPGFLLMLSERFKSIDPDVLFTACTSIFMLEYFISCLPSLCDTLVSCCFTR